MTVLPIHSSIFDFFIFQIMVRRLLFLPGRSILQTRSIRTAKVLIEPFTQNVYNRITKNSYRQRLRDDFGKDYPIGKDYLRARNHAIKGSFDAIEEFRNKYEKYGFNENIPFYLYPRFVYLICTSHEVPGF